MNRGVRRVRVDLSLVGSGQLELSPVECSAKLTTLCYFMMCSFG